MLSLTTRFFWPASVVSASCLAAVLAADDPVATRGFEVDTSDRNDVVAFYQSIYQASEGYRDRMAWTGNYTSIAAGAEGTTSTVFAGDVERRLNYFRALCGVPADVRVNTGATVNIQAADPYKPDPSTTKAAAAQRSALMIARTYPGSGGLSHNPPQTNTAWTPAAWNANKNGNLALGFYGPGAVEAYVQENVIGISSWNVDVGHRRWLLSLRSTDFGSGDTPGSFSGNTARPPTNAMYVVPKSPELNGDAAPLFHSFPAAGFFPVRHNSPYWSLSFPHADFSAATVTMRDAAMNVLPVTVVSRRNGYGDNSIVWQVPASVAIFSVASDTTFHVTVTGIQGTGAPSQHTYQVTLIDPNRLDQSALVTGESSPAATGATYQISGLEGVEQVEAGMFLCKPATWTEGAEDSPAPKVIAQTSSTYSFRAAVPGYVKSGTKAFRLTFPTRYDPLINGVPQQSFELDREIVPGTATSLRFQYRRGLMTPASKLAVESSADGGLTWTNLTTLSGTSSGGGDSAFQAASLPLASPGSPLRVRFRYYLGDSTSALYAHEDYPTQATGIFIDDITVGGGDWLEPAGSVKAAGLSSFTFNSATTGTAIASGQTWWLRARAYLGGKAFPWGAAKVVRPRGPLELLGSTAPPVTGANYSFIADPAATSYRFEVSAPGVSSGTDGTEPASVMWSNETAVAGGTTTVTLDEVTAGRPLVVGRTLQLRVRSMYGTTPGVWGPALLVTPTSSAEALTGFAAFQAYEYPAATLAFEADADGDGLADGVEYAFSSDPTQPSASADSVAVTVNRFEISRALPVERGDVDYGAEWSEDLATWSSEGVEVRIEGGKIIASAPRGGSSRMMRWVVLEK